MKRLILFCVFAAAVAFVAAKVVGWSLTRPTPVAAPPTVQAPTPKVVRTLVLNGLVVEPAALSLGEVWEARDYPVTLPIRNTTSTPIEILDLTLSCDCATVSPRRLTVPPHKTAEVTVTLDTTWRVAPRDWTMTARPFAVGLRPVFASGSLQKGWTIEGIAKSRVTADNRHVNFGESLTFGRPATGRKLRLEVHVPAAGLTVEVQPKIVAVDVRKTAPDGTRYELTLTPRTDLTIGPSR